MLHDPDIAARLAETADLLAIPGASEFRVRAYRAARRRLAPLADERGVEVSIAHDGMELVLR